MKKLTMLFVVAAAAALGAWAEMETVGGYTWTYSISGDTAGSFGIICGRSEVEYCS